MEEQAVDPNYEYEAPQFCDFHKIDDNEEGHVDSWFDSKPDDEGGVTIPDDFEPEVVKENNSKPQTTEIVDIVKQELGEESSTKNKACENEAIKPKESEIEPENQKSSEEISSVLSGSNSESSVSPPSDLNEIGNVVQDNLDYGCEAEVESIAPVAEEKESKPKEIRRSNIVTSWDRKITPDCRTDDDDNGSTADENIPQKDEDQDVPKMMTRANKRNHVLNISASNDIPSKKQKETQLPVDGNKGRPSKRSRSLCSNPEKKVINRTVPITPECLKRQKTGKPTMIKLKTTEEMEMERIAKMRQTTRKHIKANETSRKKAIACTSYHPVRMNAELTRPEEFHFETDKRVVKPVPVVATRVDDASMEFLKSLRQHPPSPTWKQRGATVPKPFNLSGGSATKVATSKRKRSAIESDASASTDSYESMAYQVYRFQTTTPPRFRTQKQTDDYESTGKSEEPRGVKITCPKTPNLTTKSRTRPISADVVSKEEQEEKEAEAIKSHRFKAKPFDRRIVEYEGSFGVKTVKAKQVTELEPFIFESDERLEIRKNEDAQKEENVVSFKAVPQPNFEKVFRPQLKHERTAPRPFSFEEKDKARSVKKNSKIQDVYKQEEKLREFKALPLPSDSPDTLPPISSKLCTSFKPFALNTEKKGAVKAEKWIQKVKTELEEGRKKVIFKAQPCKVIHEAPFEPHRSQKPMTDVSEFALNTDRRAERWEQVKTEKKEMKEVEDELRKERDAEREEEEKEAIAELRRNLVHKAKPIHKYKNVAVKPSEKALTEAASPAWTESKRRRMENCR